MFKRVSCMISNTILVDKLSLIVGVEVAFMEHLLTVAEELWLLET